MIRYHHLDLKKVPTCMQETSAYYVTRLHSFYKYENILQASEIYVCKENNENNLVKC